MTNNFNQRRLKESCHRPVRGGFNFTVGLLWWLSSFIYTGKGRERRLIPVYLLAVVPVWGPLALGLVALLLGIRAFPHAFDGGYCWLPLLPWYRRVHARRLPGYLSGGRLRGLGVHMITRKTHFHGSWAHILPQPAMRPTRVELNRLYGGIHGSAGAKLPPLHPAPENRVREGADGYLEMEPDDMYRRDENSGGIRDPKFHTLHALDPRVFESCWDGSGTPDPRRLELWDYVARWTQKILRGANTGDCWVVTAHNDPDHACLTATPGEHIQGCNRGIFLTSTPPSVDVAAGWEVLLVPLQEDEGRLLAGLRMVTITNGRTDVYFITANARRMNVDPALPQRLVKARLAYGSVAGQWMPTNNGAFVHQGCIFRPDRYEIRSSFGVYGHVYGWDEAVIYVRGPVCWVTKHEWDPYLNFRGVTAWHDTTWLHPDWSGFSATRIPHMTRGLAIELDSGRAWPNSAPVPYPLRKAPWASLNWALAENSGALRRHKIPLWGWDTKKLGRLGGREVFVGANYRWGWGNIPGGIWRPHDREHGLRSRLGSTLTQGISPEVWAEIKKPTIPADPELVDILTKAIDTIAAWSQRIPPLETVAIASVWSEEMSVDYRKHSAHLFKRWVWLSEKKRPAGIPESDLWVTLPVTRGTGFIFQLARLLPFVRSNPKVIFTCVNDIETDWLPRERRLDVGLAALEFEDIVFPAMDINAPCPFQDVIGRGNALRKHESSLIQTLATLGWVYGVDEIWCGSKDFPTVACRWKLGGASVPDFANPEPARLWKAEASGFVEFTCPGGNFRVAFDTPSKLKVRYLRPSSWRKWWRRIWKGLIPDLPTASRWTKAEWLETGLLSTTRLMNQGHRVLVIFVWGTAGDRIPLLAAAKLLGLAGVHVAYVELCTISQGKEWLALCEQRRGWELIPGLLDAIGIVGSCDLPFIAPDYMYPPEPGLAYSLRPSDVSAHKPGGGLPRWADFLIKLFYWNEDVYIRIGAYKGTRWFARSWDGTRFLPANVRQNLGRTPRRGYVLGSSSIPVPAEYADWEPVPSGDHFALFQEYTDIACAGGAGVVQTAACAGAHVHAWSDDIDRDYRDPANAGLGVEGNEDPDKWLLVAAYWYPEYLYKYAGLNPFKWCKALKWRLSIIVHWRRLWCAIFIAYSLRYSHVLPTPEATILRLFGLSSRGILSACLSYLLYRGGKWYLDISGQTWWEIGFSNLSQLAKASLGPIAAFFVAIGYHPLTAGGLAFLIGKLPDPRKIAPRLRFWWKGAFNPSVEKGVWLAISPVFMYGIPAGLHVALFDAETETLWEGAHRGASMGLGSPFYFRRRQVAGFNCPIALLTTLRASQLPAEGGDARPYSAIWNCQTQIALILLRNSKLALTLEGLVLIFGTGYAFISLCILWVIAAIASSGSVVIAMAIIPLDEMFPEYELRKRWEKVVGFFSRLTMKFGVEEEARDIAATLAAASIQEGLSEDIVFEAIARAMPLWLAPLEETTPSTALAGSIYETRRGPSDRGEPTILLRLSHLTHALVGLVTDWGLPLSTIEGLVATAQAIVGGLEVVSEEFVLGLARLLDYLDTLGISGPAREIGAIIGDFCDRVGAPGETRTKNAWAVLAKRDVEYLRRVDWLTLAIREFHQETDEINALDRIVQNLNEMYSGPEEKIKLGQCFTRPAFLPRRPRATPFETLRPSLLDTVEAQMDPLLTERVLKYLTMGGRPGIDGMWLGDENHRVASIERYFADPHPTPPEYEYLAERVAQALYTHHPNAFRAPGVVRPETVRDFIVKKYSPGLPFIGRYKRRSELISSGWMDAIIGATYKRLEEGVYPPQAYHEFVKMQVVDAEKVHRHGKLRTVVAQDLSSYFIDQVVQLERNKRPTWSDGSHGMGAPLTGKFLGSLFEDVAKRKTTFSADVTAFDASAPPFIYTILTRLAEMGAADGGIPEVADVLRAKYIAMQNAVIVDLVSGKVFPKRRGGGTGQSATSWDNTWGMRGLMMALWAIATGRDPGDFYTENTVHNTGDDNIWGTDSNIKPEDLVRIAKDVFGLELRIESSGDILSLKYLGRVPIKGSTVAEEIRRVQDNVPEYTTRVDRTQLLTRRAAAISRWSGAPTSEFRKYLLNRSVGHAALTAHDRELYDVIATEWVEDALVYLGARKNALALIGRDKDGHIETVAIKFRNGYSPSRTQEGRLRHLRKSLKLPSYQRVLEMHYADKGGIPPISPYLYATQKVSLETRIREKIIQLRSGIYTYFPEALLRLMPLARSAPFSRIFYARGYPVERYVWRKAVEVDPELDFTSFAARVRLAPYAAATDPAGFWWFQEIPGVREKLLEEPLAVTKGRMMITTGAYIIVIWIIKVLRRVRWLGLLIEAFQIYTLDTSRLYAAANTVFWIETGTSSAEISSLMPKDPYATAKQIAVTLGSLAPDWSCQIVGAIDLRLGVSIATMISRLRTWTVGRNLDLARKTPTDNPWENWVDEIWARAAQLDPRGLVIQAPTGTGKSTALPAALKNCVRGRIWLILPRIVLRDDYSNIWFAEEDVSKLSSRRTDTGGKLVICTYGYLLGLLALNHGPREDGIVLLDEFHEAEPDMGLVARSIIGRIPALMLSATPRLVYCPEAQVLVVPIPRRFDEATPIDLEMDAESLFFEAAKDHPDLIQRSLIVVPSIPETEGVREAISSAGYEAHVLTRYQRQVPKTGVIIATQVVDTGLDIQPPVSILIDSGWRVAKDKGVMGTRPSDPATARQRLGRVGRNAKGYAYRHPRAGTGPEPVIYPTWGRVCRVGPGRVYLFERLAITCELEVLEPSIRSSIDPFMRIRTERLDPSFLTRDATVGLSAWWLFACEGGSAARANHMYDTVQTHGWPEHLEATATTLFRELGSHYLPPRGVIAGFISDIPFEVKIRGVATPTLYLTIEEGSVRRH